MASKAVAVLNSSKQNIYIRHTTACIRIQIHFAGYSRFLESLTVVITTFIATQFLKQVTSLIFMLGLQSAEYQHIQVVCISVFRD